ncbi:Ig-like domain-containing protein, partial [Klebsiella pneumoniae]|nr:Ig-like domain-containing protein [Klebsiella pneumoniae]
MTLTATHTPADSTDTVQWTSSDPTIASVVSTGQKTA